jgi:hypothetical protein
MIEYMLLQFTSMAPAIFHSLIHCEKWAMGGNIGIDMSSKTKRDKYLVWEAKRFKSLVFLCTLCSPLCSSTGVKKVEAIDLDNKKEEK